jgi:type I restriction enzyme M protein
LNNQQLKQLEAQLWGTADNLRANSKLTAGKYKDPLLGLILLRYAQNRFEQTKANIEATKLERPRGGKQEVTKEDFKGGNTLWLDKVSRYDYLAELSEDNKIGEALNNAMRLIEENNPELADILPKSYQTLDEKLLRDLVRAFNRDDIKNLSLDVPVFKLRKITGKRVS